MAGLLLLAVAAASQVPDKGLLVGNFEWPEVDVRKVVFEGNLCSKNADYVCDRSVHVEVQVTRDMMLKIVVAPIGRASLQAIMPAAQFPRIDLQSARLHGRYLPNREVGIELRFGEPNYKCFVNDDARSRVDILLEEGSPTMATVTTYPGCETHTNDIEVPAAQR